MVLAHNIEQSIRTNDINISQDVIFDSMLLAPKTLQGLRYAGFYKPSPIQLHGIPLGKCGFDLLLEAKSGTGKTAVFSIIALEKLNLNAGLQAVILAPTREIASQICDVIRQIGIYYEGLRVEFVIGGLPVQEDIAKLKKKVHILVGSPGRIKHLIEGKHVNTKAVRLFVLDEADKLMEKSFWADVKYIYSALPKQKQVILSSATFPESSKEYIDQYVQNVQHINPHSDNILLGVKQVVTLVKQNSNIIRQTQHRFEELLKIFGHKEFKQCLVFCNYQARVMELHKLLKWKKWPAEQLHGQQEQIDRLAALKVLQKYECRILISTDLAARGIDACNVDLVVNFEPPCDWQTYLHRIGRAGRYGSHGTAITILSEGNELDRFQRKISSILNSSNLTYLWTGEAFGPKDNFDEIKTSVSDSNENSTYKVSIKRDKDINALWKSLTDSPEKSQVECFKELCKSFETSNEDMVVDSFKDLLSSFQNNNMSDNDTANTCYKLLVMKPIITQESLEYIHNNINESGSYEAESNKILQNKINDHKIGNEKAQKNIINHAKEDFKEHKIISFVESHYDKIKSGTKTSYECYKNYQEKSYSTSDGSSNCSNVSEKLRDENKRHSGKQYSAIGCKTTNTYENKKKLVNKRNNKNLVRSLHREHRPSRKPDSLKNSNKPTYSENNSQKKDYQEAVNRRHMDWYNNLKLRVKQIEMFVYIEELSKL